MDLLILIYEQWTKLADVKNCIRADIGNRIFAFHLQNDNTLTKNDNDTVYIKLLVVLLFHGSFLKACQAVAMAHPKMFVCFFGQGHCRQVSAWICAMWHVYVSKSVHSRCQGVLKFFQSKYSSFSQVVHIPHQLPRQGFAIGSHDRWYTVTHGICLLVSTSLWSPKMISVETRYGGAEGLAVTYVVSYPDPWILEEWSFCIPLLGL